VDYSDATPDITYSYDRQGRQVQVVQGGSTTRRWLDVAGNRLGESYTGGPLAGLRLTNQYDHFMRRTNLAVLNSQGAVLASTAYGYDEASRLSRVNSGTVAAGYSYLANSPLVGQIGFTNNGAWRMTTTQAYDDLNRLTEISSAPSGSAAVSFSYDYNLAHQRVLRREGDGSYWRYEYDALGQVRSGKKYWADGTPVAGQQFEYAFDDIGNRVWTGAGGDEGGTGLRPVSYNANALNQYTTRTVAGAVDVLGIAFATNSVTVNGQSVYRKGEYFRKELSVDNSSAPVWTSITVAATGQASVSGQALVPKAQEPFWHDADGNLLSDSLWTNLWNAENRLVLTESAAGVPTGARLRETWSYLPDGRWIERIVLTNSGSAYHPAWTNRYVWDGQVLLAILDHANGLVMSFVRGLDLSGSMDGAGGVGGVLAVTFRSNGTHFACYDGNGNVMALTDAATGASSAVFEYGPFGEPVRVTGPAAAAMPLRFSTMVEDEVTGDRKYLFREYRPSLGRWLSRDPIEEKGGFNLYGFNYNNPIQFYDADGRNPAVIVIGGVTVTVGECAVLAVTTCMAIPPCRDALIELVKTGVREIGDCLDKCRPRRKRCKPCNPAAGTTMYRTDVVPPSVPHWPHPGTHTHHYVVMQSPVTAPKPCFCWPMPTGVTGGATPAPGEIPEQPVTGGGVEYY